MSKNEPILTWKEIAPPSPGSVSGTSSPFHSVSSVNSLRSSTKKKRNQLLQTFSRTVKSSPKLASLMARLCSADSGSCLTFGRYVKPLKKLFHNFDNFQDALPTMRPVGSPSGNGFVYEIAYERRDNTNLRAHAIMKCSLPPRDADFYVDSLYYEYLVGHCFVNDCNRQFPCFLETYGAFGVTDRRVIRTMAELAKNRENTFPVENMTHYLQKFRTFHRIDDFAQQIEISCKNQFNICVLIQHISASDSMKSHFLKRYQDNNYYYYELPQLLYQVYAPLSVLGNTFTHYDLHRDNVLLYNLGADKYIQMHYIYEDVAISFKTHLIAKIIDYGRSYFYADKTLNSEAIRKKVCKVCIDRDDPTNKCGHDNGYNWLNVPKSSKKSQYVSSSNPNTSHDLRLMNEFKRDTKRPKHLPCWMTEIFNNLHYETNYGTPERESNGTESIYNINDATIQLGQMLLDPDVVQFNDQTYAHCACVGSLCVFMDSPQSMIFDPRCRLLTTKFRQSCAV